MFSFALRAIGEAVTFFSVYFVILYSLGLTLIYFTFDLGKSLPTLLLLVVMSVLTLYLRKAFQQQFQVISKRYAVDFASGLLTRFTLAFSLSVYFVSLVIPEFRQNFIKMGVLGTNLAVDMAKYILATIVGIIFASILLSVLGKNGTFKEQKKRPSFSILFTVAGILLISAAGSKYSSSGGGWYGISESVLEQIGFFCFGSIPLLQVRLLFLGRDLKE